jgi:photosystem II stability/assembly factor-like uncharacterized protein
MINRPIFSIRLLIFSTFSIFLAGCTATATTIPPTALPTQAPPTETAVPSATAIPPSETPTEVPPTATATMPAQNPISHYPGGQEFTVTTIHMVDTMNGWAIGGLDSQAGNHVLITKDGGNTWKDVTPPEGQAPSDETKVATGTFEDAQSAWVVYSFISGTVPVQSVVWLTQDSGATWQASQPLDLSGLNEFYNPGSLQFVDGKSGWLLVHVGVGMMHDYYVLYHTTDGGLTWTRIQDPYNDTSSTMSCTKTSMLFTDATHGWLLGDCHGVAAGVQLFRSSDAGVTWQPVSLPEPPDYPGVFSNESQVACGAYNPFFFGNDLGHIVVNCQDYSGTQITYFYYLYTTQDGGNTWSSNTYPGENVYFFSADTGWALSKKIRKTTDGGKTWTAISDVTWNAQMDFISEQIGWVIATADNQVALVKTDNGGARWQILIPTVVP